MRRWRPSVAAVTLAALAAGCELPAGLGGDRIAADSALHGLRLVAERPVSDAVREPSDLAFDPRTYDYEKDHGLLGETATG